MPVLELRTIIRAPAARCFDLARSVGLHVQSTARTRERGVAGGARGGVGAGQPVTWRARHFGVWQELTSEISQYDRPRHFRDSMVRGAFAGFDHDHFFAETDGVTEMLDRFAFRSPLGLLGRIADALVLTRYLRRFLAERNAEIQRVAESDEWRALLPD